ncbi:hypothetical protein RvY_16421 [Ramazzottius varieornatus]|uniref:Acid phosphatase n=1 Tax=Ramazzottius varieornatus TaxID=947166 RepID=A0A1D1VYD0_RAMVA|nr:hypothetical protein RvY_16421 [Ramazzottius varieornatus]
MGLRTVYTAVAIAILFLAGIAALETVTDLKFLVVVSRHGYRATAYTYKTDSYGESIWLGGFSSLTGRGTFQHYTLGQYLGQRYKGYIDPQKAVKEV